MGDTVTFRRQRRLPVRAVNRDHDIVLWRKVPSQIVSRVRPPRQGVRIEEVPVRVKLVLDESIDDGLARSLTRQRTARNSSRSQSITEWGILCLRHWRKNQ